MDFWGILTDIGILLGGSLVFGGIALRLGISPLVGYLLAGMFLGGAGSAHLIQSPIEVEAIAELGVSLLLFSLGLEFSWQAISKFPTSTIQAGILQIVLTPLAAFGIAQGLGLNYKLSIILALIVTLSSTATVLRSLMELREIDSVHGRYATAILLLQDIAVVPFTIIVSLLCVENPNLYFDAKQLMMTILGASALVLGLYILLNKIADPILSMFSLENNREMGVLLAIITSIGSAWVAQYIGISAAIGAFIAGMLLGNSRFAPQIRADISPLRIIFLTLFFGSAGMVADPYWIADNFLMVLSVTGIIMAFKTIFTVAIFRFCCNSFSVAVASGLCISQIGEFAFVLSSIAYKSGVLVKDLYQLLISVTIFSILLTPFIVKVAATVGLKLQRRLFKIASPISNISETSNDKTLIFILGFGPAAREVINYMEESKLRIIVLDLNQECVQHAQGLGLEAYVGDIRQIDVLKHYKIDQAKLVLVTVPGHAAAIQAINNSRRLAPQGIIIARSRYHENVSDLLRSGANIVIDEELKVGEAMAKALKDALRT